MVNRVLLAIVVPVLLVGFAAGAWSLLTGRSPIAGLRPDPPALRIRFDAERSAAAARNPGEYRVHADPRVGYAFRASSELATVGVPFRTDKLGLRVRTGPAPAPGACRVLVLGDSVAFGTGVGDGECLAQQLEDLLARARGDQDGRDVLCRTVAVPGWNWRNSFAFLRDHWDRLVPAPDIADRPALDGRGMPTAGAFPRTIVLFMPIGNDLTDGEGVWETGHRRLLADVGSEDPRLFVSLGRTQQNLLALWPKVRKGQLTLRESDLGCDALNADLGGLSARRYDAMADGIGALATELAERGARLALLQYEESAFMRALQRRLHRGAAAPPWIPLLDAVRPEDGLPDDPHPNATVLRVLAAWTAAALLDELRWVDPGRGAPLPPPPADYAGRRATERAPAEIERRAEEDRARQKARLLDRVEPALGHGLNQVYGGLGATQSLGPLLLVALPRRAGTLQVELLPLPGRDDLLPLTVVVEVDGAKVGELVLPRGATLSTRATIPISPSAAARPDGAAVETIDVRLIPDRYGAIEELGGAELASCKLVRIELGE